MRLAFTKHQHQREHNNKNTCVNETKQNGTVVKMKKYSTRHQKSAIIRFGINDLL